MVARGVHRGSSCPGKCEDPERTKVRDALGRTTGYPPSFRPEDLAPGKALGGALGGQVALDVAEHPATDRAASMR